MNISISIAQIFKFSSSVVSNSTLFDIRREVNCEIHTFLSVDRSGLASLSALLNEHPCTAAKQSPWSSLAPQVLLCHGAWVLGEKWTQRG